MFYGYNNKLVIKVILIIFKKKELNLYSSLDLKLLNILIVLIITASFIKSNKINVRHK